MKHVNKLLSVLLVLLMVANTMIVALAAPPLGSAPITVETDKTELAVGENITIKIHSPGLENMCGMEFKVFYNPDLFEYVSSTLDNKDLKRNVHETTHDGREKVSIGRAEFSAPFSLAEGQLATVVLKAKKVSDAAALEFQTILADSSFKNVTAEQTAPKNIVIKEASTPVPGTSEYAVTVAEITKTPAVGSPVVVRVNAGSKTAATYNAYDMTLTYSEGLTYTSHTAADSGANVEVDPAAHTIHVVGYGADKQMTQPVIDITFTPNAAGDMRVQATSAKIDKSNNAVDKDAPEADLTAATAAFHVSALYTVSLNGTVVANNVLEGTTNYKVLVEEAGKLDPNYDYTASYTMGGQKQDLTVGEDGYVTIPAVTGNVEITYAKTAKSYAVTVSGAGKADVQADKTAAYGTDFAFTLTKDAAYNYGVTVTIGGKSYTGFTVAENTYTIPGADITGDIAITVTKDLIPPKEFSVIFDGNATADADGAATVKENSDYTFKVNQDANYDYTVSAKYAAGEAAVVDNHDGSYTIQKVTGNLTITVNKTAKRFKVTTEGTGVADITNAPTEAVYGEDYVLTIKSQPGYTYAVTAKVNGKTVAVTDNQNGTYTIAGNLLTGPMTLTVTKNEIPAKIQVAVHEFVKLDGKSVQLVTATVDQNKTLTYDGKQMFWSDKYNAYCWLVISDQNADQVLAAAKAAVKAGTGTEKVSVDYTGDVNMTGLVDVNDAQLTYDIYNARYADFTVITMEKFLRSDVNGDKQVNVADATAIVSQIIKK